MGQYASYFGMGDYENVDQNDLDDVELQPREWDCILVFSSGSTDLWEPPEQKSEIDHDYLQLLSTKDIEKRIGMFAQNKGDFVTTRATEEDFYHYEKLLTMKALTALNVQWEEIKSMKPEDFDDCHFYFVGIREETARKTAANPNVSYELQVEPTSAITYLHLLNEPLATATLSDDDDAEICSEDIWNNMYVKYVQEMSEKLYVQHEILSKEDKLFHEDSLFRIRDRVALIYDLITNDVEIGGAGVHVAALEQKDHPIVDFFPLHTPEQLEIIVGELFSWSPGKWMGLPLEEIREYFGEYIAVYFAFLEFNIKFSLPISLIGICFGFYQIAEGKILVSGVEYFCLVVIAWSILFPMYWRRQEFAHALRWGQLRFDFQEKARPEFIGQYRKSDIDGGMIEYYPPHVRQQKQLVSLITVVCFLTALIASTVGIVLLRLFVDSQDIAYGSTIISVANSGVIMFFNNVYGGIAEKMNQWENYKTDVQYENSLIMKVFVFRFVNSYATLYYMAFFRVFDDNNNIHCRPEKCMEDLRSQVAIIFLTQIVVSNSIELGELWFNRLAKGGGAGIGFSGIDNIPDQIMTEWKSEIYERTFDDYNELMIYLGYCTLFILSFPFAAICGFLALLLEARIDGYKLCKLTRRPFPKRADDIGSWQIALEFMAWAVMLTNLALLIFVTDIFDLGLGIVNKTFEETITALVTCLILAIIWKVGESFIAKTPPSIEDHIQRMNHVEGQLVDIGRQIKSFLNSLTTDELTQWKKWSTQQVCYYLREVLLKNPDKYTEVEQLFKSKRIDGRQFAEIGKDGGEQILLSYGMQDYVQAQFISHTAQQLKRQAKLAEKQNRMFTDLERSMNTEEEEKKTSGPIPSRQPTFKFTSDHLLQMARYFEEDLAGQSKRMLWQKVDRDQSSMIEQHEMDTFLYYSIALFIRAKYPDAKIPDKNDVTFKKKIITPLQRWMLHYKISSHGLSYDEFDRYFPSWIREYHREVKAARSGQNKPNIDQTDGGYTSLRGGDTESLEPGTGRGTTTLSYMEKKVLVETPQKKWPKESKQLLSKFRDFVNFFSQSNQSKTLLKVFEKFDTNKNGVINTHKDLIRVLFAMITIFLKTKDKKAQQPEIKKITPFIIHIIVLIRDQLPNPQNITKNDFINNFTKYLNKIVNYLN